MLPEPLGDAPGVSARSALRIADVYACVRLLAGVASSLPLLTYRRTPEGRQRHEGRLAELLVHPWPGATGSDLIGSMMTSLLLHGDCFLGLYRGADDRIAQLGLLPPESVEVRLEGGLLHYLLLTADGVARLTEADVVHVRSPVSLDGQRGCTRSGGARRRWAPQARSLATRTTSPLGARARRRS